MPNFLRTQTFPFAASSTGPYRGLLVRKYPCWDAQGPARNTFVTEIAKKFKDCLEQCLPESNSFIGFSLFMVGKLPEKTKPTIMIVSDDKARRKAAFQMIKWRKILDNYPGFELGHCSVAAEFEDLRQLGSDSASSAFNPIYTDSDDSEWTDDESKPGTEMVNLLETEVCGDHLNGNLPATIHFHISPKRHSHTSASATSGGLFRHDDAVYAITMAHAIRPVHHLVENSRSRSEASSQSDDCEITGLEDWDDDTDIKTLTAITSPGSKTSSEFSDSEESLLKRYDSQLSSEISMRVHPYMGPSVIHEQYDLEGYDSDFDYDLDDEVEDEDGAPEFCEPYGSVVGVDEALDVAVIKTPLVPKTSFFSGVKDMAFHMHPKLPMQDRPASTVITIRTTHNPRIRGHFCQTPFYTRLPGTNAFLELYSAKVDTPLRQGDSGSWVYDKGELLGFVVAGNPKTESCLFLPSAPAIKSITTLLLHREAYLRRQKVPPQPSKFDIMTKTPIRALDLPEEDAMTVAGSLPPPSIFSQRLERGTPSTIAQSTAPSAFSSRGDERQPGHSRSKEDFLEDEVTRLRRELERAWEIIGEKDEHLEKLLSNDEGLGGKDISRDDLEALKAEIMTNNSLVEESRTLWRRQADANEQLVQMNQQLVEMNGESNKRIMQAIDAIHKLRKRGAGAGMDAYNDNGELMRIAFDLRAGLSRQPSPKRAPASAAAAIKTEAEPNERVLWDIPPYPWPTATAPTEPADWTAEPQVAAIRPLKPPKMRSGSAWGSSVVDSMTSKKWTRKILTPRGRLKRPPAAAGFSDAYPSGIGPVLEEDEEDEKEAGEREGGDKGVIDLTNLKEDEDEDEPLDKGKGIENTEV